LHCSSDLAVDGEMVEKPADLRLAQGFRVPLGAIHDEAAYPMQIRLLGAVAIMLLADGLAQLLQQPGLAFGIDGVGLGQAPS
jgi:hypothetical protein